MKLIIQIPCYNEEDTIEKTYNDLPKKIEGIDKIEFLLIDDGSSDKTVSIAKKLGFDYIISLDKHLGLAKAFKIGFDYSLTTDSDILVNTDGDNQYKGNNLRKILEPILINNKSFVIGKRNIKDIHYFSFFKKKLQVVGTFFVRILSNTSIKDATCGFRAYLLRDFKKLTITNNYTYTLESIFWSKKNKIKIENIDIEVNDKTRKSRLFKFNIEYVIKSFFLIIYFTCIYNFKYYLFINTLLALILYFIFDIRIILLISLVIYLIMFILKKINMINYSKIKNNITIYRKDNNYEVK
ncbi:MAG: glycosyltransferase family 2 protein [Bacilli bacterium]|nr:glycosyltransferase family 2 protein [Bacilli bacterium]